MDLSSVVTISNVAKLVAFFAIALLLQLVTQILLRKIIELFRQSKDQSVEPSRRGKRIYVILSAVVGIINFTLLVHIVYITIFTESKTIPPWFNSVLKSYGKIILYAFLTFIAYKFGNEDPI